MNKCEMCGQLMSQGDYDFSDICSDCLEELN